MIDVVPSRNVFLTMCGRCKAKTATVTVEEDASFGEVIFTAQCHGERERHRVAMDHIKGTIVFGEAFSEPARLAPSPVKALPFGPIDGILEDPTP